MNELTIYMYDSQLFTWIFWACRCIYKLLHEQCVTLVAKGFSSGVLASYNDLDKKPLGKGVIPLIALSQIQSGLLSYIRNYWKHPECGCFGVWPLKQAPKGCYKYQALGLSDNHSVIQVGNCCWAILHTKSRCSLPQVFCPIIALRCPKTYPEKQCLAVSV